MKFLNTKIHDCFIINNDIEQDNRGSFTKLYHKQNFLSQGVELSINEQFISLSNKNVLRGMHFQLPPYEHTKLITCFSGSVLDVALDLRVNSPTYLKFDSFELNGEVKQTLVIPNGVAHGFISLEDNSGMLYSTTCEYDSNHDSGILWNSFGFDWPSNNPLLSERDKGHITLTNFNSPFSI